MDKQDSATCLLGTQAFLTWEGWVGNSAAGMYRCARVASIAQLWLMGWGLAHSHTTVALKVTLRSNLLGLGLTRQSVPRCMMLHLGFLQDCSCIVSPDNVHEVA